MDFLGFEIGEEHRPIVVAEISCNHMGDVKRLTDLMDAAKAAGADVVKVQAYTWSELVHPYSEEYIIKNGAWNGYNIKDLYEKTQTSQYLVEDALKYGKKQGLPVFASVFSVTGLDALEYLECPAYKIASFECGDINFISKVIGKGKPVVISLGCADDDELTKILFSVGNIVPMHCTSAYPTKSGFENLNKMNKLKNRGYHNIFGYSDHTTGMLAAQYAVAMGASIIEKHLTISMDTEDKEFSFNPAQFKMYVKGIRRAYESCRIKANPEEDISKQFKRSIFVVQNIRTGDTITEENTGTYRPNVGIPAKHYNRILGRKAARDLQVGQPLQESDIE